MDKIILNKYEWITTINLARSCRTGLRWISRAFLAELKKDIKKSSTATRGHVPLSKGDVPSSEGHVPLSKTRATSLSLEEEAEWLTYFNKKKTEANALQSEIDRIDKEIDSMVYQLYGLTDEEIAIIENV